MSARGPATLTVVGLLARRGGPTTATGTHPRETGPDAALEILTLPLPLGIGTVNGYLIHAPAGHVLIDTGPSNARKELLRRLDRAGCTPGSLQLVLLTHGDFDHIGNAACLRSIYGARLALHPDDAGMAERGDMFVNRKKPNPILRMLLPIFTRFGASGPFTPDLHLEDGLDLAPLGIAAKIIHLPGHSSGSIGVLTADGDLFCGDLLENTKHPRLNTLVDDPEAAQASVARLKAFKIRRVYPGHGPPFPMELLS